MGEPIKQRLIKVVLSTGKSVYLREMKVSDAEKAAQKVSRRADGDPLLMQVMMKGQMIKSLIMKIGENAEAVPRDLSAIEKEDLDSLFSITEYGQLVKTVGKVMGDEDMGNEAQVEFLEG